MNFIESPLVSTYIDTKISAEEVLWDHINSKSSHNLEVIIISPANMVGSFISKPIYTINFSIISSFSNKIAYFKHS